VLLLLWDRKNDVRSCISGLDHIYNNKFCLNDHFE
jgi:hypothetical protein